MKRCCVCRKVSRAREREREGEKGEGGKFDAKGKNKVVQRRVFSSKVQTSAGCGGDEGLISGEVRKLKSCVGGPRVSDGSPSLREGSAMMSSPSMVAAAASPCGLGRPVALVRAVRAVRVVNLFPRNVCLRLGFVSMRAGWMVFHGLRMASR